MSIFSINAKSNVDQQSRHSAAHAGEQHVVHLTASRFFGGPERQMLELAKELAPEVTTTFVSFSEGGLCRSFLQKVGEHGFAAHTLSHDTPHLIAATRELKQRLVDIQADILCCHGYKANLLGLCAARKAGIPVLSVSRGWTAECWKVRLYEWLDQRVIRRMDRVICVSEGQADKVRRVGVAPGRISVIHNAIRTERFAAPPDPVWRRKLETLFDVPPTHILGAAGRLSPEKGFDVLIEACRRLAAENKLDFGVAPRRGLSQFSFHENGTVPLTPADFGVALFGEGPLRQQLQQQIDGAGLTGRFVLAGFTDQLDRYMPHFDLFVQSSHTEGLPNVLLEAAAAGVPVVATDVGGTSEVVADGKTGMIVPSGNPVALADSVRGLLEDTPRRLAMQTAAPTHVARAFSFARQAEEYRSLFATLWNKNGCELP